MRGGEGESTAEQANSFLSRSDAKIPPFPSHSIVHWNMNIKLCEPSSVKQTQLSTRSPERESSRRHNTPLAAVQCRKRWPSNFREQIVATPAHKGADRDKNCTSVLKMVSF